VSTSKAGRGRARQRSLPQRRGAGTTLLSQGIAVVRTGEPRQPLTRRAVVTDLVIAVVALAVALIAAHLTYPANLSPAVLRDGGPAYLFETGSTLAGVPHQAIFAAIAISVPLAARRRFPLGAFLVLLLGVAVTRRYAMDITFLVMIFAAYSAIAYSRFRGLALVVVPLAGLAFAATFWTATPATQVTAIPYRSGPVIVLPGPGGQFRSTDQWRGAGLLVLVSIVLIALIANAVRTRAAHDRLRAEHEAAMRRAVEQERARIASELHDVVTHNVSVMIVQAGAARQVLAETPGQARAALLAVEASGRAAMTELRNLLGLLSPSGTAMPGDEAADRDPRADRDLRPDLQPQPGLDQIQSLVSRVAATGLPVELRLGALPQVLPPGPDLAAYRVVQEALTNVIKHAGKPPVTVRLDYRDDDLVVEVTNEGPPIPAAMPSAPGGRRGLIGLRERMALYGGRLDAGPLPGGGWQVCARIPVGPLPIQPAPAQPADAQPADAQPADAQPAPAGDAATLLAPR
jgi:signal transduction histidine kinase